MTRSEQYAVAAAAAAALVLFAAAAKSAPGAAIKVAASQTEDLPPFTPPPDAPVIGPDLHVGGVVYTPHRYPAACGNDISVLIHHGLSAAALPAEQDMSWLSAPPSEGEL